MTTLLVFGVWHLITIAVIAIAMTTTIIIIITAVGDRRRNWPIGFGTKYFDQGYDVGELETMVRIAYRLARKVVSCLECSFRVCGHGVQSP